MEIVLKAKIKEAIGKLFNSDVSDDLIQLQETRKDFKGDFTLVVFPLLRFSKNTPEKTAETIGIYLVENFPPVSGFNVIKGFLNLEISDGWWIEFFGKMAAEKDHLLKCKVAKPETILVEYSSPNTNKPLHLGHIRNNLLGFSLYRLLSATGNNVVKTNIVNDRGIHICKSMLAWKLFGNGETPESTGMKGDHLVGKYYVVFDKAYKAEIKELMSSGLSEEDAKKSAPLILEAQKMLLAWENNDAEVRHLWETMNGWVYTGFYETYKQLGVDFDKIYYESETYLEGKQKVEEGLAKGVFYKREDDSVWADLTGDGLDEKLLLRSDGTSVYMTQDIGTAKLRYNDFDIKKMVYVVGNEQNYHFQVLSVLLDKLGFNWGKDLVHFSYGMVELPEGKMKSREGTVVDADDLIVEMIETARETSEELGKLNNCTESEKKYIARIVGLGALKYFILKVDPKKNMTFNPKESIDFNGNTGPFIQYTHARIKSVIRKAIDLGIDFKTSVDTEIEIAEKESNLIQLLASFPEVVEEAGKQFSPALIANYEYELVKEYNQFYHDFSILKEENEKLRNFRLIISESIAGVIKTGMGLLGIEVPERM